MTNSLTKDGLTISTLQEIITSLTESFKTIYGADIILDSNSPDGQLLNIFAQNIINTLEIVKEIYLCFDLNSATGIQLDQRAAFVGIRRQGANYSLVNVTITFTRTTAATTTQTVTLTGLEDDYASTEPSASTFTVVDEDNNRFYLVDDLTVVLDDSTPTTTKTVVFRAAELGAVEVTAEAIDIIVTSTDGVESVLNSDDQFYLGVNEETDPLFRARIRNSRGIYAQALGDAMRARILEIDGVKECYVYENFTNTVVDTIPAHSVWVVVYIPSGVQSLNTQIAQAMYDTKTLGAGMKDDDMLGRKQEVLISNSGIPYTITFYHAILVHLYVDIEITRYSASYDFDLVKIASDIASAVSYNIGQTAQNSDFITATTLSISNMGVLKYGFCSSALLHTSDAPTPLTYQECGMNQIFIVSSSNISITYA